MVFRSFRSRVWDYLRLKLATSFTLQKGHFATHSKLPDKFNLMKLLIEAFHDRLGKCSA